MGLSRRQILALAAGAGMTPLSVVAADPAERAPLTMQQMERIVCVGGAITEIVYALGLGAHIVAVDTTSLYPPEALLEKRSVGYMRALSPEGVLSANPTCILLLDGAGPPQVVDLLVRSSVRVVQIDGTPTAEAVAARVSVLAALLGVPDLGQRIVGKIEQGFAQLAQERARRTRPQRVLFVLSLQNGRPIAAGRNTAADAILGLSGAVNVAGGFEGYKPMSDEAVIAASPEVVLTMEVPGQGHAVSDILDVPALRATAAGRLHRLIAMDGEALLGFGPRTPDVAMELMQRLALVAP
jgi:heme transport system substrate-binding protein